jgi:hypothetical protein
VSRIDSKLKQNILKNEYSHILISEVVMLHTVANVQSIEDVVCLMFYRRSYVANQYYDTVVCFIVGLRYVSIVIDLQAGQLRFNIRQCKIFLSCTACRPTQAYQVSYPMDTGSFLPGIIRHLKFTCSVLHANVLVQHALRFQWEVSFVIKAFMLSVSPDFCYIPFHFYMSLHEMSKL